MRISNWSSDVCSSDLLPVSVSDGLWGNSAVVFGGNQANGSYSAGVGATLFQAYQVDLKYTDYFGSTHDDGTKVTSQNGFTSLPEERSVGKECGGTWRPRWSLYPTKKTKKKNEL